jgi:peptidyl-prolyl cis-trans isomerase C
MSKIANTLLLFSLFSIALAACNKSTDHTSSTAKVPALTASTNNVAVATVNGKPLEKAMFDIYLQQRLASRPDDPTVQDPQAAVEDAVNREVIYQEALNQNLDKTPMVMGELENSERNILANALLRNYLDTNKPTDEALKKEYDLTITQMAPQENKASHILVKDEQAAKDIIKQLDGGADFAGLAKEKSLDVTSGKEGGSLGWFQMSQMVKPFSDAVASMQKGSYSKTPVQTEFGWHIIFLEDTRDVTPPPFDQVKENVRAVVQGKLVKDYLAQLKAKAKVEIKQNNIVAPNQSAAPIK